MTAHIFQFLGFSSAQAFFDNSVTRYLLILTVTVVGACLFAKWRQLPVGRVLLAVFGGIAGLVVLHLAARKIYYLMQDIYASHHNGAMIRIPFMMSHSQHILLIFAVLVVLVLLGILGFRHLQRLGYDTGRLLLFAVGGVLLLAAVIAIIVFVKNKNVNAVNYIYLRRY